MKPPSVLNKVKLEYIQDLPEKAGFSRYRGTIKHPTNLTKKQKELIKRLADWFNDDHIDELKVCYNLIVRQLSALRAGVLRPIAVSVKERLFKWYRNRTPKFIELKFTDKIYFKFSWTFIASLLIFGWAVWPHTAKTIAIDTHRPPMAVQGIGVLEAPTNPIEPLKSPEMPKLAEVQPPIPRPIVDNAGNTYDPGQCTWFAKSKRPDLPNNLGNADTWAVRAAAQGYKVTDEPRAGAIGQVRGNMHVVYVDSVNDDGTVNVSAMNEHGPYGRDSYTAPASRFIYIW